MRKLNSTMRLLGVSMLVGSLMSFGCAMPGGGMGGGNDNGNTNNNGNGNGNGNANGNNNVNDNGNGKLPGAFLIAESDSSSIIGFENPEGVNGDDVAPDTLLENTQTGIEDIAVNAAGDLYVLLQGDEAIQVFSDARTASGGTLPARTVTGEMTEMSSPFAIAIDKDADVLYFSNEPRNFRAEIRVFDGVSTNAFDGDIAPNRTFMTSAGKAFHPLQLFAINGDLWVVDDRDGEDTTDILVFENAVAAEDVVDPNRTITSTLLSDDVAIWVDDQDRLFVVDQTDQVLIFEQASMLNGEASPDIEIQVVGAQRLNHVLVDSTDTMYLADGFNVIFAIKGVSDLSSGPVNPDRMIEGSDISSPDKLDIVEADVLDGSR
jgi:hypothetical protein